MPGVTAVPGAGDWETTTPRPWTSSVMSKDASAAMAPRSERPWSAGMSCPTSAASAALTSLSGDVAAAGSAPPAASARMIGTGVVPCCGTFMWRSA